MVSGRLDRMVRQVRRWRGGSDTDPLPVGAKLSTADVKRLRRMIDLCIEGRGGELAARRRATAIGATFLDLDAEGRHNFFRLLADEYGHDTDEVDHAMDAVLRASHPDDRLAAERDLARTLRPKRELLLRRFVGLEGGLPFLVDLREELLSHRQTDSAMAAVDDDLRAVLENWFDLALLRLERLTWDSPAATLEKLIEYEAVHAIESWDDLHGRLGPGRRCYAFFHPMMPGEPLIFVEVALTQGIVDRLEPILDHSAERPDGSSADTAIFYSISNCHRGLAGVSLGDFLIKNVVDELSAELPNLKQFATLSPIPRFRSWLIGALHEEDLLAESERQRISPADPTRASDVLEEVVAAESPVDPDELDRYRTILTRLAARYLLQERSGQRALDPVAHFHLSNGARVERLNWMANRGQTGWDRGLGMMVNYRYLPKSIESNHDRYVTEGAVEAADEIEKLLKVRDGDG